MKASQLLKEKKSNLFMVIISITFILGNNSMDLTNYILKIIIKLSSWRFIIPLNYKSLISFISF